ncbi:hypothetical protein FHS27_004415 [Rhodopirellula rubra]|uniref:Uncharacterized protein n=1 Tax=Aporhodopirellula rubra TaxID=980271 RepID=A0A7W5E1R0_9BACT|nr:hypothetical protein [Aporhodopirellula rubra]MBB3208586.1 hypothetical protein [Aporhodopirellula rubra]
MNSQTDPTGPTTTSVPVPHRLSPEGAGPAVEFTWQGDRYAHVLRDSNDASTPCCASLEGGADDDWPSSAAIQQLSTEVIDGKTTILGVGCCGTSHFSVSVQYDASEDASSPSLRFDWAARLSKPLATGEVKGAENDDANAWLGSSYREETGSDSVNDTPANFRFDAIGEALINTDSSNAGIQIQPRQMAEVRTVQWSYRVQLRSAKA